MIAVRQWQARDDKAARLLAGPRRNDLVGRALAVTSGVAFDVLRFGHLAHHRFNRHAIDRPDVIPEGRGPVMARAAYYAHLLGGVWLAEAAATLLMLAPRPLLERLARKALSGEDRESRTLLAGTLAKLDPAQVSNIKAAASNARAFAAEVVALLKRETSIDTAA